MSVVPRAGDRLKGMSPAPAWSELHSHSAYSFMDGASPPAALAGRAAVLGYRALALTDHDNLCGLVAHARACAAGDACER